MSYNQFKYNRWTMDRVASGFLADQRGSTAIEYALIAAGVGLAIIASVNQVGTDVAAFFASVAALF